VALSIEKIMSQAVCSVFRLKPRPHQRQCRQKRRHCRRKRRHCRRNRQHCVFGNNVAGFGDNVAVFGDNVAVFGDIVAGVDGALDAWSVAATSPRGEHLRLSKIEQIREEQSQMPLESRK